MSPCRLLVLLAALVAGSWSHDARAAQDEGVPGAPAASDPEPAGDAPGPDMTWWREARFGLFIHWGVYAVPAGEWHDETHHGEWIHETARIPMPEYERLKDRFSAPEFDPERWAAVAKSAGMKYVVITSKHHDGFCMFDTAQTDWNVMHTPLHRDVIRAVADAFRAAGLRVGFYHSIMDWHHPDYLPRRAFDARPAADADFGRYVEYLRAEVGELLTNYAPVDVLWFDGEWEATWTHELGESLFGLCRRLSPATIVNDRVDKGRSTPEGILHGPEFRGDFRTPEQEVPGSGLPGIDWESCITMNEHWGFNRADTAFKPAREIIRLLVDVVSKGGNLLLNVGPTPEGTFPPACVERLEAVGRWLAVNGDAIYGTTASPLPPLAFGRATAKREGAPGASRTRLFLHVFDWPSDGRLVLPGVANSALGARALGAPERRIGVTREGADLVVAVGPAPFDQDCSVVEVDLDGAPEVFVAPRFLDAGGAPVAAEFVRPFDVLVDGARDGVELDVQVDGAPRDPDAPVRVDHDLTLVARLTRDGATVSPEARIVFRRVAPGASKSPRALRAGLVMETFAGTFEALPDMNALLPVARRVTDSISLGPEDRAEGVARRLRGLVFAEADDVYDVALTCDDGGRVRIDARVVAEDDGPHVARTSSGRIALARGWHAIEVEHFNRTGDVALAVEIGRAGTARSTIPPARLAHEP